jgi:hypothetical protein
VHKHQGQHRRPQAFHHLKYHHPQVHLIFQDHVLVIYQIFTINNNNNLK